MVVAPLSNTCRAKTASVDIQKVRKRVNLWGDDGPIVETDGMALCLSAGYKCDEDSDNRLKIGQHVGGREQ